MLGALTDDFGAIILLRECPIRAVGPIRLTVARLIAPGDQLIDDRLRLPVANPIAQSYRFCYQVHGE